MNWREIRETIVDLGWVVVILAGLSLGVILGIQFLVYLFVALLS